MTGQRIGNYLVVRQAGRGGMASVFEAVHVESGQRAAVKVLNHDHSCEPGLAQRFKNEARAAGLLTHPGVVRIFDQGALPDGCLYLIMEFLEGETLGQRLQRQGRLPAAEVRRLGRQVASAVAAAHAKGIIHRDLKPDNVFIVTDPDAAGGERARVLDFGIAKLTVLPLSNPTDAGSALAQTHVGAMMGTPHYMSPEQCCGARDVDGQADVYSLGVMLFQMLTGRLPFKSGTPMEVIGRHLHVPPEPLVVTRDQPQDLVALINRALSKDSRARPTMREVVQIMDRGGGGGIVASTERDEHSHSVELVGARPTIAPMTPRRSLALLCGVVVALCTVGLVWWRSLPAAEVRAQAHLAQPPPIARAAPAPRLPIAAAPPRDHHAAAPPRDHHAAAAAPTIEWTVRSEPSGAEVLGPQGPLGRTPLTVLQVAGAGKVTLRLRKAGYRESRVEVDADKDSQVKVPLVQSAAPPAPPRPRDIEVW